MQPVGLHVQQLGGGAQREEQGLRRGVADDAVVGLRRRDGAIGFHRRLLDGRHLIAPFDHPVGAPEGLGHVAEAQLLMIVLVVVVEGVVGVGLIDHRGVGRERLLDVENMRQHLVIDPHRSTCRACQAIAGGHDGQHRFALVGDLAGRDQRLVVTAEIQQAEKRIQVIGDIFPAHDTHHPLHALGGGCIDGADAGMVMRAPDAAHMQQPLEEVIVEIRRPAGHMAQRVLTLRRLADLVEIVVTLVGEQVFAKLDTHPDVFLRQSADPRRAGRLREWQR